MPTVLGDRLARAAGLRNGLVHGYTDIDHRILFGLLRENLADLEAFAAAAAEPTDDG